MMATLLAQNFCNFFKSGVPISTILILRKVSFDSERWSQNLRSPPCPWSKLSLEHCRNSYGFPPASIDGIYLKKVSQEGHFCEERSHSRAYLSTWHNSFLLGKDFSFGRCWESGWWDGEYGALEGEEGRLLVVTCYSVFFLAGEAGMDWELI